MKREMKILAFILFVAILCLSIASAFQYNGENIVKNYIGGEKIRGYINISFNDDYADSILKSNFYSNGTKLIDLLRRNNYQEGQNFNCSTSNCQNTFIANQEIINLPITSENEEYIGMKLIGKNIEVTDISFQINSDAQSSCSPGFSIDVLGNESSRIQGNSYNDIPCGDKIRGCFDKSLNDYDLKIISNTPYCEKLELPNSPAFRIGAKVTNSSISGKLTMRLFDENWDLLSNCILPKHNLQTEELSCIINFTNTLKKDYYVCIETDNSKSEYKIESEIEEDICGKLDVGSGEFEIDYNIFAQPLQYNPQNITINNNVLEGINQQNLIDYVNEYLDEKYSNDCSETCVIPFKINPSVSQILTLSNVKLRYESSGGTSINNKIYFIEEERAKIDSKNLKINIEDAELYIPLNPSSNELQLFLDGEAIFPKKIKINITAGFSFDISPKLVPFAIETYFLILTNQNITNVKWNFGNGEMKETTTGFIKYTYLEAGDFNITVEATNSKNAKSVQTFKIIVGNVSQSLNNLINQSQNKINSLSKSIDIFEPWIKEEIIKIENVTDYENSLSQIRNSIEDSNQSDMSYYASQIYSMNIPRSVNYTDSGNLPLEIGFNSLDSNYIINLEYEGCLEDECNNLDWVDNEKVNDYLISWNSQNFNSAVSYQTLSRFVNEENEPLLTYFNIQVKKINNFDEETYLIIPYPFDSIKFKSDYGQIKIEGDSEGIAIPLSEDINIEFLIPGKVSPIELGVFASPNIDFIIRDMKIEPSCEDNPELEECGKRSGLWLYILLFLGFLVVYIILQEWYKKRYEGYLFPNRDDLYNIINYVHNSRLSGMSNGQINKTLLDMKWKNEQIVYAFKKIDGRRTGMWEIPIFKFFENRKVRREIEKRKEDLNQNNVQNNQNGGNARFFNRPR